MLYGTVPVRLVYVNVYQGYTQQMETAPAHFAPLVKGFVIQTRTAQMQSTIATARLVVPVHASVGTKLVMIHLLVLGGG